MTETVTGAVVLLVEDDASVRDVIARFLGSHGYQVVPAASAEEALALIEAQRIDILVTDIVLPGLDGFNMAAEIARRSRRMPMYFMSGQFDPSMAIAAGWAADTPVLRKPFALLDLLRLLREPVAPADAAGPQEMACVCDEKGVATSGIPPRRL
jgi:two-component system, cell cycle sensor histidine kinase and response regulator CckA